MQTEKIKILINWLQSLVVLKKDSETPIIIFNEPNPNDMLVEGFDQEMIDHTLKAPWWGEMVTDIRETPDFAQPDETSSQVLQYARDVVHEYVGKRIL